ITDGGFIKKTSTLLLSEETRIKREILSSFVIQGIKDLDKTIYATSRLPSHEIINELRREIEIPRDITVLDLYQSVHSSEPVLSLVESEWTITIPLNKIQLQYGIVSTIKKYPKEVHKRVVLDVYSDFLRYHDWKEISEMLYKQIDGFRRWNCTSIIVIDPALLSEEDLEELIRNFDNVILVEGSGVDAFIKIEKLYGGTPAQKVIFPYR
ncbi:MAG: hypothetical protein ACXQT5_03540, partial [Candidatus Syntropharchaeia archaeon]